MKINQEVIENVYQSLAHCREALQASAFILAEDKLRLDVALAKGLADGTIVGKNQQLRDAASREVLADLYEEVDLAQIGYDESRLNFDLAQYKVDEVRLIVRLLEISYGN